MVSHEIHFLNFYNLILFVVLLGAIFNSNFQTTLKLREDRKFRS